MGRSSTAVTVCYDRGEGRTLHTAKYKRGYIAVRARGGDDDGGGASGEWVIGHPGLMMKV